MKPLNIGKKSARIPVIQGGMGVGVSLSRLAGSVAAEGGIGVISTAQIGFDDKDFAADPKQANIRAIKRHIKLSRQKAAGSPVAVNIMTALKDYPDHVKAAIDAGADAIISGAGLPTELPALTKGSDIAIAPIVSSEKATRLLLSMWDRHHKRTADFVVVEGPKAGGHLGFSPDQLKELNQTVYDREIKKIIETVKTFEEKYSRKIPVIIAGGISSAGDVHHAMSLGADGVQVATRFVVTEECDASQAYKEAYLAVREKEIEIINSPVGMPGRAIHNGFLELIKKKKTGIGRCYGCLKHCNPAAIPYCITEALIRAVRGDIKNGLVFCGANAGKLREMTTVPKLMAELAQGF